MKSAKGSLLLKLWRYFALFTLITLVLLWLLQTVFLQSFYNRLQQSSIARAAAEIAQQIDGEDSLLTLDRIACQNNMQLILTDWDGTVWYSVDPYSSAYRTDQNPYSNGSRQRWRLGMYRNLPEGYADFLQALAESEDGRVCYALDPQADGSNWIYGQVLSLADGETLALYINAPIGAVSGTVAILRTLLLAVTLVLLLVGLLLAYLFARRFSRPIAALSVQARAMAAGKGPVCFARGFCRELDHLAEALDQTAQELARLEEARRQLLANITHDLRTPLTLIAGYAEKIEDLSWEERAEARSDAALIRREADRLTLLVQDILDRSVLEGGAAALELGPVDLSALAQQSALSFRVICERQQRILSCRIEPDLPVLADERRMAQVLYNLLVNGLTHVGADRTVELRVFSTEDRVRVEVCDHGAGIPPEDLPHIWARYFTSRERRRSGLGTGLGLAIVQDILVLHQARYGVDSQVGQGSCFWFELPRCMPQKHGTP